MYKSIFVMFIVLASATSINVSAADKATAKISPMVLIELGADMKADWVYSERMLTVDIKNDLLITQKLSTINPNFLRIQRAKSMLTFTGSSVIATDALRLKVAE